MHGDNPTIQVSKDQLLEEASDLRICGSEPEANRCLSMLFYLIFQERSYCGVEELLLWWH